MFQKEYQIKSSTQALYFSGTHRKGTLMPKSRVASQEL